MEGINWLLFWGGAALIVLLGGSLFYLYREHAANMYFPILRAMHFVVMALVALSMILTLVFHR
jgi:hypothetical protein